MLRILFTALLLLHGVIHLMGFLKAVGAANLPQLGMVSRRAGLFWLLAAVLFVAATVLYLMKHSSWIYLALAAVIVSQTLILFSWKEAKWGTIANMIVLPVVLLSFTSHQFEKKYRSDAREQFRIRAAGSVPLITEADLQHLPPPVQQYLRYCEVVDKPRITNMRVVFEGQMRGKDQDWFPFTAEQYSFFDDPVRLFFMKGRMKGVVVPGYHRYVGVDASMNIRLFGLKDVVNLSGPELSKGETVILFNDWCLMAPGTLIDPRIRWEQLDQNRAKATFTNDSITVSAVLYFNQKGQLLDFISEDRYEVDRKQWFTFSTPVSEYRTFDGRKAANYGEALWHYPEGAFTYGRFRIKSIEYNVKK